ncbi:hypothetical protein N9465_00385 [Gammaproteobacteria bacterium]|nr:hypothetical protein [Gammaproteobacteria bacterium]
MGATYTRQKTYTDGDIIQASDTNDEFDQLLAAFASSTGHSHDGTTGEGGPVTKLLGTGITIGDGSTGTDITVTFDGESNDGVLKWMEDEDYFEFSDDILIASTEKIQFRDTGLYINSSADGQLDLVADTEIQIAATTVDINGLVDISGNLTVGGNLDVTGTFDLSDSNFTNAGDISLDSISGDADSNTSIAFSGSDVITVTTGGSTAFTVNASQLITASAGITSTAAANTLGATSFNDANITNVGSIALDTITNDGTDITLDSSGDVILDADGGDVFVKDAGTTYGSLTNSSGNLVIKSGTTTALTFSGANATLAGDLTISGDDLTMATNTSGALLIADGTNFNPTVVGDLSEISTVANDDVFMAIDTSGGGLKKITRSSIVAGLAASGAISNVVDDSTPQLGGNLDMNGADIVTTSNATLDLAPNGTGTVVVRGNTNSGAVVFNCESNSHGQKVYGQPHSAGVTNTLMLPAGADSTLVSLVSTDTLTNKTLTSPKINEDVAVTSTATELNLLDGVTATTAELNVLDGITAVVGELNALDIGSTAVGTAVASKAVILDSDKDYTGIRNFTITGNLSVGGTTTTVNTVTMEAANAVVFEGATADAHETTLTIVDPTADRTINLPNQSGTIPVLAAASNTAITSTPAELNILDGVTSTATELNLIDGSSAGTIVNNKAVIYGSSGEVNATTLQIAGTSITSTAAELNILDGVTSTAAELNILDGVTATAAELNLLDGGTSVGGSITVADADGFVVNDGGTMKTIPATDVKTYAAGSAATKGFAIAMAIVFG